MPGFMPGLVQVLMRGLMQSFMQGAYKPHARLMRGPMRALCGALCKPHPSLPAELPVDAPSQGGPTRMLLLAARCPPLCLLPLLALLRQWPAGYCPAHSSGRHASG